MKQLLLIVAGIALALGGYFYSSSVPTKTLGSYNVTGGGTYRLQSSIGSTATSLTLTSFKEPVSNIPYTMSYLNSTIEYATIEPQSTSKEFVSFTGITQNSDGTATLTGLSRGLSFSYPFTASSTFQQAHSGQTILILSNPPQLYNQFHNLANVATSTNTLIFSSTTPPYYDSPAAQANGTYISTTSELASIAYVNAVALVSSPNGTTAVKGVYQSATGLQAASSTSLGSTGASLVLRSAIATDTPSFGNATSSSLVVVSDLTGHIKQTWLDLTKAWSFAASSVANLTLNAVAYVFPTSQGSVGTSLTNDGSGNLSWIGVMTQLVSTTTQQTMTYATTTTFSAYSHLKVDIYQPSVSRDSVCLNFNNDYTTAIYGYSSYTDYALIAKSSLTTIQMGSNNATTTDMTSSITINNSVSKRKQLTFQMTASDSGAHAPLTYTGSAVWNNTSAQITQIILNGSSATGCSANIPSGTTITVYGYN